MVLLDLDSTLLNTYGKQEREGFNFHTYKTMKTFIVTNMGLTPIEILKYYCNCGTMENFTKECKNGFDISSTGSKRQIVNANRLQLHVLA